MTIIYYNEYIGDDDEGQPMYREGSYDDGENDTTGLDEGDQIGGTGESVSGNFSWGDAPGAGSNTKVDATTGNITYTYDDGSTLTVGPDGNPVSNTESPDAKGNSAAYNRSLAWATKTFGPTAGRVFSNMMQNPGATLATALAAAKAFSGSDNEGGYNKPIPQMEALREQINYNDPNRRAGSGGRQYVTDTRFVKEGDAASKTAAQTAVDAQKQGILAAYKPAAAEVNPWAGKMNTKWNTPAAKTTGTAATGTNSGIAATYADPTKHDLTKIVPQQEDKKMAAGGIAGLARGGNPRYLQGETDGMADKLPAKIDQDQPAALSHGEFVIPADVVSHLGNGNSDAGAKKLYQMMDRIRQARTGTKEQGKKINPDKFMPGGLAAAYSGGGDVKGYNGATGSAVNSGGIPLDTSKTSTLSPWAGESVTNMLGRAEALAKTPTAVYTGPLTAGESNLQKQGFAGISDIASAGYDPTSFSTGTFDATQANKYMNPYLKSVLDPQLAELRRQNDITNLGTNAKLTQAGAFGGGRQAIMNAENNRNLMQEANKTVGTGYASAFDKAMAQFNAEQGRQFDVDKASEESRKYSADYGLKTVNDLIAAGAAQRGIEAEGVAADKKQFEEQQADPYNRLEFQRKMFEGLPIGASTTSVNQDALSKMQTDVSGLVSLYDTLKTLIPTTKT